MFARENGVEPSFFDDWCLGSPIDKDLSDDLASFYLDKFERCRETGEPWAHEYLCPAPTVMRRYQMRILPLESGGWLVIHTKIVEQPIDAEDQPREFLDAYLDEHGYYHQCAHCRRYCRPDHGNQWDWVPALFAEKASNTSHGLCETCLDYYHGETR